MYLVTCYFKMKKEDIINIIDNLEKLEKSYYKTLKDTIATCYVVENQLVRLNQLLSQLRNMMADGKEK